MGIFNTLAGQHEIVAAFKRNDNVVLKQLYMKSYPKIENYILKNNGDKSQAKDIYQEAFLATWKNIHAGKFSPSNETAIQGYLFQVARNKWTDYLRSKDYKSSVALGSTISITETDAETEIDSDARLQDAMKAFDKLGGECKELLSNFYFEKRSLREIADLFGIGEASTRNKKYRCINKLRAILLSPTS